MSGLRKDIDTNFSLALLYNDLPVSPATVARIALPMTTAEGRRIAYNDLLKSYRSHTTSKVLAKALNRSLLTCANDAYGEGIRDVQQLFKQPLTDFVTGRERQSNSLGFYRSLNEVCDDAVRAVSKAMQPTLRAFRKWGPGYEDVIEIGVEWTRLLLPTVTDEEASAFICHAKPLAVPTMRVSIGKFGERSVTVCPWASMPTLQRDAAQLLEHLISGPEQLCQGSVSDVRYSNAAAKAVAYCLAQDAISLITDSADREGDWPICLYYCTYQSLLRQWGIADKARVLPAKHGDEYAIIRIYELEKNANDQLRNWASSNASAAEDSVDVMLMDLEEWFYYMHSGKKLWRNEA